MRYKEKIIITNSFEETQKLGEGFVKRILLEQGVSLSKKGACVIALYGDLGSGKTTFVQGIGKGLGLKRRIISPTFIIVRSYKINGKHLLFELVENYPSDNFSTTPRLAGLRSKNKLLNPKYLYHIDLYRITGYKDIEGLGIEEIMNDPQNIVAIEWAEKMGKFLPEDRIDIRFDSISESKRRITINIKYQKSNIKNTD